MAAQQNENPMFLIVSGPSTEMLFLALRLSNENRRVHFTFSPEKQHPDVLEGKVAVRIWSIGVEDGSGESWMFTFSGQGSQFEGYFRTNSRSGWARKL